MMIGEVMPKEGIFQRFSSPRRKKKAIQLLKEHTLEQISKHKKYDSEEATENRMGGHNAPTPNCEVQL